MAKKSRLRKPKDDDSIVNVVFDRPEEMKCVYCGRTIVKDEDSMPACGGNWIHIRCDQNIERTKVNG